MQSGLVLDLLRVLFFERISCHPSGCFGIHVLDLVGAFHCQSTKVAIAFPNLPQCPVNGVFHKIPLNPCVLLDQWEKLQKCLINCVPESFYGPRSCCTMPVATT